MANRVREYLIFDYRPAFCYGGGHKVNAYPTFNRPWKELREILGADVCNYACITAVNKPQALAEAKRRWL